MARCPLALLHPTPRLLLNLTVAVATGAEAGVVAATGAAAIWIVDAAEAFTMNVIALGVALRKADGAVIEMIATAIAT